MWPDFNEKDYKKIIKKFKKIKRNFGGIMSEFNKKNINIINLITYYLFFIIKGNFFFKFFMIIFFCSYYNGFNIMKKKKL